MSPVDPGDPRTEAISAASVKGARIIAEQRRLRRRRLTLGLLACAVVGVAVCSLIVLRGGAAASPAEAHARHAVERLGLPGEVTSDGGLAISREDYGEEWPLRIDKGVLHCDEGAVTLEATDATYALDSEAQSRLLGEALAPVWEPRSEADGARMSTARLIEHGRALCQL